MKPHFTQRADGSMRLIGYKENNSSLMPVGGGYPYVLGGSWATVIDDPFPGAWQANVTLRSAQDLLAFPPVYACVTLIAGDIAKLRMRLTRRTLEGIWLESGIPANSPFTLAIRSPNHYQTPYQFWSSWIVSRLLYGNTFVLKSRDNRGIGTGNGNVRELFVLDPRGVEPLVADTGEVFYRLSRDYLNGLDDEEEGTIVPASEIIHDRVTPLWHPLIGVSPLFSAAMSGTQGMNISNNATRFFANMSRPGGMLVAPGPISQQQMQRVAKEWQENYGGVNQGKTAILGDGMTYVPLAVPFDQSQVTEQAQDSAKWVAMAFHVPPYKLGLEGGVKFNNMEQQDLDYYKQCLQSHMESAEQSLDAGLELPADYRSEFDERGLFRMDPKSRAEAHAAAIRAMYLAPNEARFDEDLPPVEGGDEPISQQQNWPLSTLAKRPPPDANAPVAMPPADPAAKSALVMREAADLFRNANPHTLRVVNG